MKPAWFLMTWITAAILSLAQPPTTVRPPADCAKARGVLKQFLELDAKTGRKWTPQLTYLITDTDNPGWDTQLVIRRYEIGECQSASNGFVAPVRYWILGRLTSAGDTGLPVFLPGLALQNVRFEVVRVDDRFKVRDAGSVQPHVYPGTAIEELKKMAPPQSPEARQEAVRTAKQLVRKTATRPRQSH